MLILFRVTRLQSKLPC